MTTTTDTDPEYYRAADVDELLDDLEEQISEENMMGVSREMVVEGTFSRIRRELTELQTTDP